MSRSVAHTYAFPAVLARFQPGRRRFFLASVAGAMLTGLPVAVAAETPLPVVATFSILGDMVQHIGGDRIALTTIVGPEADAHSYEPAPADLQQLAKAKVLVANGLQFEGWLPRLREASGFSGALVEASEGTSLRTFGQVAKADSHHRHAHGDQPHKHGHNDPGADAHDHNDHGHAHEAGSTDPHAWQDLANGAVYARNIAQALIAADPAGEAGYRQRLQVYLDELTALDATLRREFAAIPDRRRKVVTSHDAFGYFSAAYGVQFIPVTGLAGHAEVSARQLANIVNTVRGENVAGIFLESGASARLVEQIARETGSRVGGVLYSDALAAPGSPADTYLGMFRWNAEQLLQVMKAGG